MSNLEVKKSPDECMLIGCNQKASVVIVSVPYAPDDYINACSDHAPELRRPTDEVFRLADNTRCP